MKEMNTSNENREGDEMELTGRSNLSGTLLKQQVMENLSPLRLVDVLACSYGQGIQNFPLQFATLQLVNQICDEAPMNYKLICLSGILAHLKEFSKESIPLHFTEQSLNQLMQVNASEITPKEIKVEIAYFILKAYVTSNEAVMMIFANQGYKILS